MLFQLPEFLAFAVLLALALAITPRRWSAGLILAASIVFYGWWSPPYVVVILGFIALAWLGLLGLHAHPARLPALIMIAVTPLLVFKYSDFLLGLAASVFGAAPPHLGLGLPLGISFITFSVISLLVDSRRRDFRPPSLGDIGLYICFFPHLIAGPILRPHQIMPQLRGLRLDWRAMPANLVLFAVGMAKKVLIADPLATILDPLFAQPHPLAAADCALAVLCFPIQLYCDFSAYSDMAIALAAMLGIAFPHNFHSPYGATSLAEIWRRWHMTLSFWLRDYVFKPLHKRWRDKSRYLALVVTMSISGLWHGAGLTFLVWGFAQGLLMAAERACGYDRFAERARGPARALCIGLTFLVWSVLLAIFRTTSIGHAFALLAGCLGANGWGSGTAASQAPLAAALCLLTLALHRWDRVDTIRSGAARLPLTLTLPVSIVVIAACALIAAGRPQSFYYFVF